MAAKYGRVTWVSTFVAGGLLGAGLAVLLAPQSGKKTRRDLRFLGKKMINRSDALGIELNRSIHNLFDDVSERLQEGAARSRDWTRKLTKDARTALESGLAHIDGGLGKSRRAS